MYRPNAFSSYRSAESRSCHHLSDFKFRELLVSRTSGEKMTSFINDIDVSGLMYMKTRVGEQLLPGFILGHQYDFGTTSPLTLSCQNI